MSDLEPATSAIDMTPVDHPKSPAEEFALKLLTESWIDETGQHDRRVMARLIQEAELAIRADEREPLESRARELEERLAKLSLYDELRRQGISVGLAQQGLHMARATCEALGLDFETTAPVDITERIQRQDARIASLEAQLEGMTGERDAERVISQEWESKAYKLEAQLASAREEALREADQAITKRIEAEEAREAKMPPGESESVVQSAAICGLEWARHELMALLPPPADQKESL